jgi:hypothetical protein
VVRVASPRRRTAGRTTTRSLARAIHPTAPIAAPVRHATWYMIQHTRTLITNHAFAGQLNCFTQLRALLVLNDHGNVVPK